MPLLPLHALDPATLGLAVLAAWLVGLSKGGLPTIAMLSVPLMATTMSPLTAAALLLPIYIASDAVGIWLYRRHFSARHLRLLIPAGLLGIAIGWATASVVSDRMVAVLIGVLGLGHCLNTWLGPRWRAWRNRRAGGPSPHPADGRSLAGGPSAVDRAAATAATAAATPTIPPLRPVAGWGWGTLCGFTSFIAHAGGPPYQIYTLSQRLDKLTFAGTSTLLFAVINLAKIVPYQFLRPYDTAALATAAWLLPPALIGTVMGAWATRRLPERGYFAFVQLGLLAVSVKLLVQALA